MGRQQQQQLERRSRSRCCCTLEHAVLIMCYMDSTGTTVKNYAQDSNTCTFCLAVCRGQM
jgi:hypothetical protein